MDPPIYQVIGNYVILQWSPPTPETGNITRFELILGSPSDANHPLYFGLETTTTVALQTTLDYRVRAVDNAGAGPFSASAIATKSSSSDAFIGPQLYAPLAIGIVLLLLLVISAVIWRSRRNSSRLRLKFVPPTRDEWEYDRSGLVIGGVLGRGNFGVVYAAVAEINGAKDKHSSALVAFKTISTTASDDEKIDFVAEADLMKGFSKPPHVNVCEWIAKNVIVLELTR